MKKTILPLLLCLTSLSGQAQRIYQKLGRGVVAVTRDAGKTANVSWRKMTNDPDSCTYNLYKRAVGATSYTKVNTAPLTKTFYQFSSAQVPLGSELAVTTVSPKGIESEKSTPFYYKKQPWNNVWMYIELDDNVIKRDEYCVKYVWPCDLNGDGEYNQFIVDRLGGGSYDDEEEGDSTATSTSTNHKLQAYDIDGTLLWTIALGPNVNISSGHNDMVTVCDIDCDGKAEVIIRSSDGTRFWDKQKNDWGKYVFGKDVPDIDGDGIVDYASSENTKRNPPFYISVIDGMSGEEKTSAELKYAEVHDNTDQYSRDNRADYWSTKGYYQMGGHFAICYDGIRPYVAMKCLDRALSDGHHDYIFAFGYDWVKGKPTNFHHFYTCSLKDKTPSLAVFHGNRVCDVDGDGIDELIPGAFAANPWKGIVSSAGIGHGDRFTVGDLDPTRPGLEHFAIQQSGLLGQIVYDAATGEHLKEWYLPSVWDIGRGQCQDVDSTRLGYECYSYVNDYIYDIKGHNTGVKRTSPCEGLWWDGDLLREAVNQRGGSGRGSNLYVEKVPSGGRIMEFSRESEWRVHGQTGTRAAFWGDIMGDWREEIILMDQGETRSTGIVGYTTSTPTDYTITALIEDSHYRGDVSCRGYYQSPNTSFYLGHSMKQEPIYDCVKTDLRYKSGWSFTSFNQTNDESYADGKSLIFDLSGDNKSPIQLVSPLAPSAVYIMNPKGHDYTFTGTGTFTGAMDLKKGMQGTTTFNMNLEHTGKTVISEGTLCVNGSISSPLYLMSRGTLAGNATIHAPVFLEGALNHEGCRFMPGNSSDRFGTITFARSLMLPGDVYIETDLETATEKTDKFIVKGNLTLQGTNYFNINCHEASITPGIYTLAECTGTLTAEADKIKILNLDGVPYSIQLTDHTIQLVINTQRQAADNVAWVGNETASWDYLTKNFKADDKNSYFITGDKVVFDDNAQQFDIHIDNKVVTGGITFNNNEKTYTLRGDGAISGTGDLVKNGRGEVRLEMENSDFTGRTIINEGKLTVIEMSDAGKISSIGAPVADKGYLQINGGELCVDGDNVATDRMVTISDTATINITNTGSSLTLKGQLSGRGILIKDGAGQLNMTYAGTNDFDGLIIRGGTIMQGQWQGTFGKSGAPITFEGGTLRMRDNQSMSTIPQLTNPMFFKKNTNNQITGSYRCSIRGKASGSGTLTLASGGVRCDWHTDFSEFAGTIKGTGTELRLQSSVTDMKQARLQPTGSIGVEVGAELHIGALIGDEKTTSIKGSNLYVGYLNDTCSFAGVLRNNTVTKVGTGVWELTGTSSESSIVVKGGALKIRNFTGSATSSSLTVEDGGMVIGRGTTQSILLRKGSVFAPGIDASSTGTLSTRGNFIAYGGSILLFKIGSSANDMLNCSGTIRLNGDTIRIMPIQGRTFNNGESIQIIEGTINANSKWIIDGAGYDWDDSQLLTSGKLICKGSITNGIDGIAVDEPDNVKYFDINGTEVTIKQIKRRQVYIQRVVKNGIMKTFKARR